MNDFGTNELIGIHGNRLTYEFYVMLRMSCDHFIAVWAIDFTKRMLWLWYKSIITWIQQQRGSLC